MDVLLRRGDVLDVAGSRVRSGVDIAVRDGVIAEMGRNLSVHAATTVDLEGALVTPGLVDMHTHVYAGGGYYGLNPDEVAWRSGVTTWVDAGSAGAYTITGLMQGAGRRQVRIRSLLNVSVIGLAGESYECRVLENCDVDRAVASAFQHRQHVVGIKARIDHNTVGEQGLEPLRRAVEIAQQTDLPLMVHLGAGPPAVAEILGHLRAGDIVTHCATGVADGLLAPDGSVSPSMVEAYARGVRFDVGHGIGGFSFEVMEALLEAGLAPHTISSDLHATSVGLGAFDLPTVMTKMLAVGQDLEEVVQAATQAPVSTLGLSEPIGVLTPGALADIAVFDRIPGPFTVSDAYGSFRTAPYRLVNRHTFAAGNELAPPTGVKRAMAQPSTEDLAAAGTYARPVSAES